MRPLEVERKVVQARSFSFVLSRDELWPAGPRTPEAWTGHRRTKGARQRWSCVPRTRSRACPKGDSIGQRKAEEDALLPHAG